MPFSRLSVLLASSALVSLSSYADNATAPGEQNPYRMLSTIVVTGSTDAVDEVAGSVSFLTDADLSAQAQSDIQRVLRVVPGVNIQEEDGYGRQQRG